MDLPEGPHCWPHVFKLAQGGKGAEIAAGLGRGSQTEVAAMRHRACQPKLQRGASNPRFAG